MFGIAPHDLTEILQRGGPDIETLRGANIFITGGTGFFGKWLLASLDFADAQLNLRLKLTILSRDPQTFFHEYREVSRRTNWNFIQGRVSDFATPPDRFDYIIHAAGDTTGVHTPAEERERETAIVAGSERILNLAQSQKTRRVLVVSSGAVYGVRAGKRAGASEGEFDDAKAFNTYGEAKRLAEQKCTQVEIDCVFARAFAFLGPHLPLNAHFAAGNFLRDALRGGPIEVHGDGTALRSYLYPSDLVIWLLAILTRGRRGRAYNVGSDEIVSTNELAQTIAREINPAPKVIVQAVQPPGPQNIYLPNIARAREELGLQVNVNLAEAIRRTLAFHKTQPS